jgi:hypothetical protein
MLCFEFSRRRGSDRYWLAEISLPRYNTAMMSPQATLYDPAPPRSRSLFSDYHDNPDLPRPPLEGRSNADTPDDLLPLIANALTGRRAASIAKTTPATPRTHTTTDA